MGNTKKTEDFDKPQTFMQHTQQLLNDHELNCLEIYRDTGINYHWLKKFGKGGFPNPSVNRVQCLYEFLTGTKLFEG